MPHGFTVLFFSVNFKEPQNKTIDLMFALLSLVSTPSIIGAQKKALGNGGVEVG